MARNEVLRNADQISLPVPAATPAGTPVVIGAMVGITETPEGQGGNVAGNATVWRKGAHRVPVTGAVTAVGQPIYIPTAGGALTTTVGSNVLWGFALETKGAGTGPIVVALARV